MGTLQMVTLLGFALEIVAVVVVAEVFLFVSGELLPQDVELVGQLWVPHAPGNTVAASSFLAALS